MKALPLTLLAALALAFAPAAPPSVPSPASVSRPAQPAAYTIDPAHTNVGFRIRHMGVAFVEGEFDTFEGTITYDPADVAATRAEVTVQTASIDTDVQQRDDHLRSADFFEVETYPTMTFTATRAQPTGQNTFRLIGDLTIKGVTREVAFDVEAAGPIPIENGQRVGFYATTEVDRRDFGITWGGDLPGGIPAVGHRVQLVLDVEAVTES
jgi:polyisoprenoid-binding protein YceI